MLERALHVHSQCFQEEGSARYISINCAQPSLVVFPATMATYPNQGPNRELFFRSDNDLQQHPELAEYLQKKVGTAQQRGLRDRSQEVSAEIRITPRCLNMHLGGPQYCFCLTDVDVCSVGGATAR